MAHGRHAKRDGRPLVAVWEGGEAEKRALIRGAIACLGKQQRVAEVWESILTYLSFCCGGDQPAGSRVRVGKIAANAGVKERAVHYHLVELQEAGLVAHGEPVLARGHNRVEWDNIRAIALRPSGSAATARVNDEEVAVPLPERAAQEVKRAVRPPKRADLSVASFTLPNYPPPPAGDSSPRLDNPGTACRPSTADASANAANWDEVVVVMRACGLTDADGAVSAARARGLTAAAVLGIAAHWRAMQPGWGAGLLHWRLRTGPTDAAPTDGWPPPSKEYQRARQAEADAERSRQQLADREQEQARRAALTAECQAIDAAAAAALDRLSADELEQLASQVLQPLPALWALWRKDGVRSALVRSHLLDHLNAVES